MYFVYAAFSTKFQAQDALERYFAEGLICEGERPYIERRRITSTRYPQGRLQYCVMFPGA